jgi:protein-disulfide isomerase
MTGDSGTAKLAPPVSERDHIQGPGTAAVTLVEYGDYECPFCGQAYPIVKEIQRRLGDQLRFVFRNFPLTQSHPHAEHAAEAAEAAGAQDRFWEMHDYLFEHQRALDDAHLLEYAAALDLDQARFKHDLTAHTFADRVREDFRSGVRSGVNGTPTFFINGTRHDDSYDLETLLAALEAAGNS